MRITNSMIASNSVRHITGNKNILDNLYVQLSTGKVIQKASENPIIAIRALRFRSEISELEQYLKRNIPDARSWMQLTEDALTSVQEMVGSMVTYMDQGANGTLDTEAKQTVIETLKQYHDQIHQDANATYSGRSIFTGYKTNSNMTFEATDTTIQYDIKETFTGDDLDKISKIGNSVDITSLNKITDTNMPENYETYRLRLSYDKLEEAELKVNYTEANGNSGTITATQIYCKDGKYYSDKGCTTEIDPYGTASKDTSNAPVAYFIAETGEVVMNEAAYITLKSADSFSVDYTKVGFEKGELRPEHYFDCVCTTHDGIVTTTKYTASQQDINYTVNFNQTMKVNTEGKNVFKHEIVRDIDELIDITQQVLNLEEKVAKIKSMKNDSNYASDDAQEKLESMLAAANKELDYATATMKSMYGAAITTFKEYENVITTEISDIGARSKRLTLNETRLSNQKTSLEDLKSVNEDIDESEVIINLTVANNIYQASLSATSKLISTSLLDYI